MKKFLVLFVVLSLAHPLYAKKGANVFYPLSGETVTNVFTVQGLAYDKEIGVESVRVKALRSDGEEFLFPAPKDKVTDDGKVIYTLGTYSAEVEVPDGEYELFAMVSLSNGETFFGEPNPVTVSSTAKSQEFIFFSAQHLIPIAICLAVIIGMVIFLKKKDSDRANAIARWVISAVLIIDEIILNLWHVGIGDWRIGYNLLFHMCGLSILTLPIMLLTKNEKLKQFLFEMNFFWGLAGAMQAMLTPDIGHFGFPHFRYFSFFISHFGIWAAIFYQLFVEGDRPKGWGSVFKTVGFTLLLLIPVGFLNWLAQFLPPYEVGNYFFMTYPPVDGSVIDLFVAWFGPAPWYMIGVTLMAVIMFSAVYLPFWIEKLIKKKPAEPAQKSAD